MKLSIIATILLIMLTWIGHLFLPWWYVSVLAFAYCAMVPYRLGIFAFLSAFTAVGVVWLVQVYLIDTGNESILSTRMASLMGFEKSTLIILFTSFIGALLGGLFGICGHTFRKMIA